MVSIFVLLTADTGEADHFIGQDSPPTMTPVSRSDSSVALFAGNSNDDSFRVGFGNAPLSVPSEISTNTASVTTTMTSGQPENLQPPISQDQPPNQGPSFQGRYLLFWCLQYAFEKFLNYF